MISLSSAVFEIIDAPENEKKYLLSRKIRFCFKNSEFFLVFTNYTTSDISVFGQSDLTIEGFFLEKFVYLRSVSKKLILMHFSEFNCIFIGIIPQMSKFIR